MADGRIGFAIAPLDKGHDRKQFACGQPDLDEGFQRRASQDDKRNIARVFVATDDELGVVGFYSLSSFTLTIDDLPEDVGRKLPRYDAIPAAPIGPLVAAIQVVTLNHSGAVPGIVDGSRAECRML